EHRTPKEMPHDHDEGRHAAHLTARRPYALYSGEGLMALSASVTYSAVSVVGVGAVFNYEVLLHNTSPAPFAVYGFVLNLHINEDPTGIPPLKNVRFISAPPGWYGQTFAPGAGLLGLSWSPPGFQGDAITSGYIMPGQYGVFRFQSTTPPPDHMPF